MIGGVYIRPFLEPCMEALSTRYRYLSAMVPAFDKNIMDTVPCVRLSDARKAASSMVNRKFCRSGIFLYLRPLVAPYC
jgi:hypothetical protein